MKMKKGEGEGEGAGREGRGSVYALLTPSGAQQAGRQTHTPSGLIMMKERSVAILRKVRCCGGGSGEIEGVGWIEKGAFCFAALARSTSSRAALEPRLTDQKLHSRNGEKRAHLYGVPPLKNAMLKMWSPNRQQSAKGIEMPSHAQQRGATI